MNLRKELSTLQDIKSSLEFAAFKASELNGEHKQELIDKINKLTEEVTQNEIAVQDMINDNR